MVNFLIILLFLLLVPIILSILEIRSFVCEIVKYVNKNKKKTDTDLTFFSESNEKNEEEMVKESKNSEDLQNQQDSQVQDDCLEKDDSENQEWSFWKEEPQNDEKKKPSPWKLGWGLDTITLLFSIVCEYIYFGFVEDVDFGAHWTKQLYNKQLHQPINTEYIWGPVLILVLYFVALIMLYYLDLKKTPPLVIALAMGAIYLGSIYFFVWFFHSFKFSTFSIYLFLQPLNIFLISTKIILHTVREFKPDPNRMSKIEGSKFLSFLNNWSQKATFVPIAGLVFMIPVLGITMLILLLFGQAPDSAIKAFTETSDFLLSTKVSPQNLYFDEHYLCTVAAGGDRKVVKPLRKGLRHGHPVIVNRQLQVANAFEEIIMVKTPKAHRRIRHFYDTYGFPVAKAIKKKWIADMVYFIMKPLEWIFIVVLYFTEVHPEDRIALQYTGTTLEKWNR